MSHLSGPRMHGGRGSAALSCPPSLSPHQGTSTSRKQENTCDFNSVLSVITGNRAFCPKHHLPKLSDSFWPHFQQVPTRGYLSFPLYPCQSCPCSVPLPFSPVSNLTGSFGGRRKAVSPPQRPFGTLCIKHHLPGGSRPSPLLLAVPGILITPDTVINAPYSSVLHLGLVLNCVTFCFNVLGL